MKKILIIISAVIVIGLGAITLFVWKPWRSKELWVGRGNTTSNISNLAKMIQYEEWHYYAEPGDINLYKIPIEGGERKEMGSSYNFSYFNIVGNWIYFNNGGSGIDKMRIDGRKREVICEDNAMLISVVDGWLYYINAGDNNHIYRIKIDGTNREKLNDVESNQLNAVDGWLYYAGEDYQGIYKMKMDGTDYTVICEDAIEQIHVVGDWIYYSNESENNHLYRIKTDGTGKERIGEDVVGVINVSDDWIYYSNGNENHDIYKMRIDGTERELLRSDAQSGPIVVLGDWIYYHERKGYPFSPVYRMKTDGSRHEKIDQSYERKED